MLDLRAGGRYWYSGGIAWRAVIAWAVAIVVGFLFTSVQVGDADPVFVGTFASTWIGANGLGWIVTFIVAAAVYVLTGGPKGTLHEPADESAPLPATEHA
ncbi:cytosine permease [Curtobacterium flaccumfaciens]|nr:cytosine permease [Curtobacterium flaccumfaciens]